MELGNIVFGNSRGEFPLERSIGFEEELIRLFEACDPDRDNSWCEYGVDFENDVFFIMPYYWGDCTCGYDEKEYKWCENNKHESNCYTHEYKKCVKKDGYSIKLKKLKKVYQKYGWEIESKDWWYGCAIRCSCNYHDRWMKFVKDNGHDSNCPIVKPNFLYKPIDFQIQWYKYPLRDAYTNCEITLKEFKCIIDNCIKSIKIIEAMP